jgi:outer membrane protein TolC
MGFMVLMGLLGFAGNRSHAQPSRPAGSSGSTDELAEASAWTSEERDWVRKVLRSNRELARQRLTRSAAGVDVRMAEKAMRPVWTLEAAAEAAPDAKGPATLNLGNSNVTLGPGQDRYASQASLGLSQALPTGGEIGARLEGGARRPEGGSWQDTQAVEVDIRQPLLRGLGSQSEPQAALTMARNEEALAEAELRAQLLATIFQARNGYWNLMLQARQMRSLRADSAYWEQSLRAAEARHRLGDLAEDEYLRYRIQALDARQNLLEGRLAYRSKTAELLLLLGDGDSAGRPGIGGTGIGGPESGDSVLSGLGLHFNDSLESEPPLPATVEEKALSSSHPTWLRLAHLRQRMELQVKRARDAEKPRLDVQASWRKPRGGRSDARLGASFAWTLPALSANRDLQNALLQAEAQKLDSAQTLALLRMTLARLADTFATQRERFRMAVEKSGLEAKRSRIAERRHALGDIDFTELQLSARDRLQAEQDVTSAYVALRLLNAEMEEWNGRALAGSGVALEGVRP